MLQKFSAYLLHNPYWGLLHESAENQTFGPVDSAQFEGLYETEKEIFEIWNGLTVGKRKELVRVVEESIESGRE